MEVAQKQKNITLERRGKKVNCYTKTHTHKVFFFQPNQWICGKLRAEISTFCGKTFSFPSQWSDNRLACFVLKVQEEEWGCGATGRCSAPSTMEHHLLRNTLHGRVLLGGLTARTVGQSGELASSLSYNAADWAQPGQPVTFPPHFPFRTSGPIFSSTNKRAVCWWGGEGCVCVCVLDLVKVQQREGGKDG